MSRVAMSPSTVFLSYASEDLAFVEGLAGALKSLNVPVWHAAGQLNIGDSIVEKISAAMGSSRIALLVISPSFLAKAWPKKEFHSLIALGVNDPNRRLIPILHQLTDQQYLSEVPMMADIKWLSSDRGLEWIVCNIRVALAEPADRALPRQAAVIEHRQKVTPCPDLKAALDAAGDGANIFLYPGVYEAPPTISKRVTIAARGAANDTIVQISKGATLIFTGPALEVDGVSFIGRPTKTDEPAGDSFTLFETSSHHPYVRRGDALIAIVRHEQLGQIRFKNCTIDGAKTAAMLVATDARIEFNNCRLFRAESGLNIRNGGHADLAACAMNEVGSAVDNHATLALSACTVTAGKLSCSHGGLIEIKGTQMNDSYAHAYSGGKVSVSHGSKFQQSTVDQDGLNYVYATQYSQITAEDSEFEGGNCAFYAYGGSLLTVRRSKIRRTSGWGIRYSEGCSGDIEDTVIQECGAEAIRVQKEANPRLVRSTFERNAGGGVVSVMGGHLNLMDCHVHGNGRGGIVSEDGGEVKIQKTRVFLNDGPGIQLSAQCVGQVVESEIGQNARGQLLIAGERWFAATSFIERWKERFGRKRAVRVIRTAVYH